MEKELVTIIIPCYNAEPYLKKCFDSLLNQTYRNIEVIIVNDGSTDESEKIIDEYSKKFLKNNMKFMKINQENQGQAAAINNALKFVSGTYLMWQDSDDWYETDAVENLHDYLVNNNLNVLRGEAVFRDESDLSTIVYHAKSNSPCDNNLFDKYFFESDSYCFPGIFIIRMSHFDNCVKNREIYCSRAGQNWQLILPVTYNEKSGYLNKIVYNYRISANSHSHSVKKLRDLIKRCDEHKDILKHVLDDLNMKKKDKGRYIIKLNIKYYKKKIRIILSHICNKLKGVK